MSKPGPFRYFKRSPEIIRLPVMLYVRFPLSLRIVEDLLPLRRRERAMQRFRRMGIPQKFAGIHGCVSNHFNRERSLYSRPNFKLKRAAALTEWRQLGTA